MPTAVFDKFLARFRRKETPITSSTPTIRVHLAGLPGASWTGRDYASMVGASYGLNSDVFSCVSLIAQTAKQVRWSEESASAASRELLKKAGGPTYIESWVSYILLAGNSYTEVGRNAAGAPVALYLLNPARVSPVTNINMPDPETTRQPRINMWRVTDAKGNPYPVIPADTRERVEGAYMAHSKTFNPFSELIGMPPLQAAMLLVDAQNEGAALMKRMLQAGFSPGWIEAAENSDWGDVQVEQLKQRLRQSRQAGEALFLENAKWHEMGFKPVESGVSEQQVLSKRDIASIFHVPSVLVGDAAAATYSNYREARLSLYQEAVLPWLHVFVRDWNATIGRDLNSQLAVDKDSFEGIAAARSEAADRVHKLWTAGLITQNEARRDLEYDEAPGGDVFYAPANFLPLAGSETER